jgi:hypothetical protein
METSDERFHLQLLASGGEKGKTLLLAHFL